MTASAPKPSLPAPAALNVYKKVAIIRGSEDVLTYEDKEGNYKTVTDLHLAAVATTPLHKPKPKDDIPVPTIRCNETYEGDILPNYDCPTSYVRYTRLSHEEVRDLLEYVIDTEDEAWLRNNTRFGGASMLGTDRAETETKEAPNNQATASLTADQNADTESPSGVAGTELQDQGKPKNTTKSTTKTAILTLSMLEVMLDVMEKATALDAIITLDQAESLILKKLPQLYHMYPIRAKAGVVTIRHVMNDVYQYWVSKRSKLKRPLLRRFWPVTSTEDSNPHLVFRPREKEKYKLRKKRQNDMDAYRKLQQLKQDFSHVRLLLGLIKKREELGRSLLVLQKEWFEQKLYDAIDTSGLCRISQNLDRRDLDKLLETEKHFDVQEGNGAWKRKKSRRSSGQHQYQDGIGSAPVSRSTSPVPAASYSSTTRRGATSAAYSGENLQNDVGPDKESGQSKVPMIIAGQNGGEPAPSFLQPLGTRESYATTWVGSVPHVTTIVDGQAMNTTRFRHRPRVGRGGRLCIDRVPITTNANIAPSTYFRAGSAPPGLPEGKQRLLDLLPTPIDKDKLSRRIKDICLNALKEEYDGVMNAPGKLPGSGSADDVDENDGVEVVVKLRDWLNTDDQLWGEERYAIGPI